MSLKQHPVHHLTQLVHVAVQHMAVHIQRRGNVTIISYFSGFCNKVSMQTPPGLSSSPED